MKAMQVLFDSVIALGGVAIAVLACAVVAWLFGHVLGMPLPRGPWGW